VPEDIVLGEEADDFRQKCFAMYDLFFLTFDLLLIMYLKKSNPEERPTATELRKHPYLLLPTDWEFTGFT
jgi:hypothetical protein